MVDQSNVNCLLPIMDEKLCSELIEKAKRKCAKLDLESSLSLTNGEFKKMTNIKAKTLYSKTRERTKRLMRTQKYHLLILSLVGVHCLCVLAEFIIEFIHLSILKEEYLLTKRFLSEELQLDNKSHILLANFGQYKSSLRTIASKHSSLDFLEKCFKINGTLILGLFTLEVVVKCLCMPKCFIKAKWEALDACIVTFSFAIDLVLFRRDHISILTLIVLLK
jgi:hypothetical protein